MEPLNNNEWKVCTLYLYSIFEHVNVNILCTLVSYSSSSWLIFNNDKLISKLMKVLIQCSALALLLYYYMCSIRVTAITISSKWHCGNGHPNPTTHFLRHRDSRIICVPTEGKCSSQRQHNNVRPQRANVCHRDNRILHEKKSLCTK